MNRFAVGCQDGTVLFCDIETKKCIKAKDETIEAITEISWNPGEDILAIVYASGNMRLYSMDNP